MTSAKITWESMSLSSVISRFVVRSELFRQRTYMKQNLAGDSWNAMVSSFRKMVARLYEKWHLYLQNSLRPGEEAFFEAICHNTASVDDHYYMDSLAQLSHFLARKSGRKVMVFIDEYEAPIIRAYEHDFFGVVRPLYPSRLCQD
jgi:hypothetical protein